MLNELLEILMACIRFLDQLLISPLMERIFLESIYFIPSLFVAIIFIYLKRKRFSLRTFHAAFLSSRIWATKSSKIDYLSLFLNILILGLIGLVLEQILSGDTNQLSLKLSEWLTQNVDIEFEIENPLVAAIVATTLSFLVLDFYYYWFHRAFHSYPLLWKMHSRHHSATNLTIVTNFRGHPLEALLRIPLATLSAIFIGGLAHYLCNGNAKEVLILGVNLFAFLVLLFGGVLVHTHIFLRFPRWLSIFVVSPAMHQVHHSIYTRHHNKNYGSSLGVWDFLFGTLYLPKKGEKVKFGIKDGAKEHNNIFNFLFGHTLTKKAINITQKQGKTYEIENVN